MAGDTRVVVKDTRGRSLKLGQLYDCRNDNPEDGASLPLWDEKVLLPKEGRGMRMINKPSVFYAIDSEETNTTMSTDIDAVLDLSAGVRYIASGSGTGHYSDSKRDSNREVRTTLKYKYTSRFEELTMSAITAEPRKSMLKYKLATHVVTGVEYGIDMNFTFVYKMNEFKDCMDLDARIKAKVLLWNVADKTYHEHEEDVPSKFQEKVSCQYDSASDIKLESKPETLKEAIEKFREMSSEIASGKRDNEAVPKRVWLMPLTVIDSSAPRLARSVSDKLVTHVQTILNNLYHIILEAKDLKELVKKQHIPAFLACITNSIQEQIDRFGKMIDENTNKLKKNIKEQLKEIRSDHHADRNEDELRKILDEMTSVPFDIKGLMEWVSNQKSEAMTLIKLLNIIDSATPNMHVHVIEPITCASEDREFKDEPMVMLQIKIPPMGEPYLKNMEAFLEDKPRRDVSEACWYKSRKVIVNLRSELHSFAAYSKTEQIYGPCVVMFCKENLRDVHDIAAITRFSNGSWEQFDLIKL